MAGMTQADASGSHPRDDGASARHITRDRVQLYADRLQSPTVRHAAALRARADAVARQQGVVRFGRQPARRAERPKRAIVASAVATATMLLGGVSALASGGATHTVVQGDTLSELAERYSTTVADLARENDISDPDLIIVGDELQVTAAPATTSASTARASTSRYTVVEGDTIEDIAWAFGATKPELVALNGLSNPDLLQIGQVLLVPARSDVTAATVDGDEATAGESNTGEVVTVGANGSGEPSAPTDVHVSANDEDATDDDVDASAMTDNEATDAGSEAASADTEAADTETSDVPAVSETPAPAPVSAASLHLTLDGETLDSIAALYGVSADELLAANAQAAGGVSAGMILKIPATELSGIQLVGMPVSVEADSSAGEAAAVEIATGYWAASIAQDEVLAQLPQSDDPHQGFRAVDGYGVYAEPLAALLESYGFHAGAFYGDSDTLRAQLDSGIPVIAWTTQGMQVSELAPYTDRDNDFNLAPDKQAVVVYGYDDSGVFIVDPSDGQYKHVAWEDFQAAWDAFGDMALSVAPI
jgi:LysM repeat protein